MVGLEWKFHENPVFEWVKHGKPHLEMDDLGLYPRFRKLPHVQVPFFCLEHESCNMSIHR